MSTQRTALATLSSELSNLAETAGRYVASVAGRGRRPSSGIAIGGDHFVTADHTLDTSHPIAVVIDGVRHDAELAGRDPATDLALLRVPGVSIAGPPKASLPAPGALVLSVARTGSGTLSTGLGVITSVGGPLRTGRGVVLPHIIRTDAALRPGTAGGALIDMEGRVLGMTTPGLLRGLPVAVPAAQVWENAERLAAHRPLKRGYLGVSIQPVTLTERQQAIVKGGTGLLVAGVADQGPAARAGVLVGDVLVSFGQTTLEGPDHLQDALAGLEPGTAASLAVLRGVTLQSLDVTVGERSED